MLGPLRRLSGRALGLVLIFITALIWVAASFISQLLVTQEEGRTAFNVPPLLLTYLSTSIFTVFLPLVQLKALLQETRLLRRSFRYQPLQEQEAAAGSAEDEESAALAAAAAGSSPTTAAAHGGGSSLTADLDTAEAAVAADAASAAARASREAHREALTAAAQCFLLWFAAQWLFNTSLALTSVTSNTILSSSSSLFTFGLSMIFLKEPYSAAKLGAIAACMGGTLLVTLSDDAAITGGGGSNNTTPLGTAAGAGGSLAAVAGLNATGSSSTGGGSGSGPGHSVWGDLLSLLSACCYAGYTIVLRRALPDEGEANVALFFGYVGLLCSAVFAPLVALLAGLGALHLQAIPPKAYAIILVQGVLNYLLSDYLWAHAVLLLGPTIATLGLSVQIPVAAAVEAVIGHPAWLSSGAAAAMTLGGTALIMAGFVGGNLADRGAKVAGSHHRGEDIGGGSAAAGGLSPRSFGSPRETQPSPAASPVYAASHPPPRKHSLQSHGGGTNTSRHHDGSEGADGQHSSIPVSTHARIRSSSATGERSSSPGGRGAAGSSGGGGSSSSPRRAAAAAAGGSGSPTWREPPKQPPAEHQQRSLHQHVLQHQQQQQEQARAGGASVELSSLSSSTPRSEGLHSGCSPTHWSQQQQQHGGDPGDSSAAAAAQQQQPPLLGQSAAAVPVSQPAPSSDLL